MKQVRKINEKPLYWFRKQKGKFLLWEDKYDNYNVGKIIGLRGTKVVVRFNLKDWTLKKLPNQDIEKWTRYEIEEFNVSDNKWFLFDNLKEVKRYYLSKAI